MQVDLLVRDNRLLMKQIHLKSIVVYTSQKWFITHKIKVGKENITAHFLKRFGMMFHWSTQYYKSNNVWLIQFFFAGSLIYGSCKARSNVWKEYTFQYILKRTISTKLSEQHIITSQLKDKRFTMRRKPTWMLKNIGGEGKIEDGTHQEIFDLPPVY